MKHLLDECRQRFRPAPRVMSVAQAEAFRLRLRPRTEFMFRDNADTMVCIFDQQEILRERGQVVWGHLVQANSQLFDRNNLETLPANVLFSLEPFFDDRPKLLGELAHGLFAMKGSVADDPSVTDFVHAITDERARILNRELPRDYCHGHSVYFTSCFIQPGHLPGRYLTQSFFPVVVCPQETKAVLLLPASYWPEEMLAKWDPLPVKPAPKRPKVVRASPDDDWPSGVPDSLPPPPRKLGFFDRLFGKRDTRRQDEAQWARLVALNPDNEELLLAFADCLDACGEPQGELIRLDLKKSRYPEDENDPRYMKYMGPWLDFMRWHEARWLQPLTAMGLEPWFCGRRYPWGSFHRGLLDRVYIDRPGILPEQADRLFAAAPALQKIDIQISSNKSPEPVFWEPDLPRMLWIPQMRQIHELNLHGVGMNEEAVTTIGEIPYLTGMHGLSMGSTFFGPEGAIHLARSKYLVNLRDLCLANWDIGADGICALAGSRIFAHMTSLDLLGGCIGPDGANALFTSRHLGPLQTLRLGSNYLGDQGLAALVRCPALAQLATLTLGSNKLTAAGVALLAGAPMLTKLTHLELDSNMLCSDSVAALARSPHLSRLRVLVVSCNAIDDAGVKALGASTSMRKLTDLNLGYNKIGDAGAVALAESANFARLQRLEFGNNQIGPDGARALSRRCHCFCWPFTRN